MSALGEWDCARCTCKNPMASLLCSACDAARPPKAGADPTPQQPTGGPEWQCTNCPLLNPSHLFNCDACDVSRPEYTGISPQQLALAIEAQRRLLDAVRVSSGTQPAQSQPIPKTVAALCQEGHPLAQTRPPQPWVCDVCQILNDANSLNSMRCSTCDFDICEHCFQKGTSDKMRSSEEERMSADLLAYHAAEDTAVSSTLVAPPQEPPHQPQEQHHGDGTVATGGLQPKPPAPSWFGSVLGIFTPLQSSHDRPHLSSTTKELQPPAPQQTCGVCLEDDKTLLQCSVRCSHPANTCRGCFDRHITYVIETPGFTVRCPSCDGGPQKLALEVEEVRKSASRPVFDQYADAMTRAMLSNNPPPPSSAGKVGVSSSCPGQESSAFLTCSSATCQGVTEVVDGDKHPVITCQLCGTKTCFRCKSPWHPGLACEEYQRQLTQAEAQTQEYFEQNTRTCPKCSYGPCYKEEDDCAITTCDNCTHRFCWECGCDYACVLATDCKAHKPTCKYYQ